MEIVYEDHWKDVPVYDEQTKQVVVQRKLLREPVYVADDGQRFNSIDDCRDHEEYLNGTKKICPRCGGRGEINIEHHHGYDPGVCGEIEGDWGERCPECDGKGFLRLVTTTKWVGKITFREADFIGVGFIRTNKCFIYSKNTLVRVN